MPHRCFLGFSPGKGKAELRKQMERKPWRNKSGTVSRGQRWTQSSPCCPGNWTVPTEPPALLAAPGRAPAFSTGQGKRGKNNNKKGNINANSGIGVFSFIESPQAPTTSPPGPQHPSEDPAFPCRGGASAGLVPFRAPGSAPCNAPGTPQVPPSAPRPMQASGAVGGIRLTKAAWLYIYLFIFSCTEQIKPAALLCSLGIVHRAESVFWGPGSVHGGAAAPERGEFGSAKHIRALDPCCVQAAPFVHKAMI